MKMHQRRTIPFAGARKHTAPDDEPSVLSIAGITKSHWTIFVRCNTLTTSPLFSSKDRLCPLISGHFFCCFSLNRQTAGRSTDTAGPALMTGGRLVVLTQI